MEGSGHGERLGIYGNDTVQYSVVDPEKVDDVFLGHSCITSEAILYIIVGRFSVAAHGRRGGGLGALQKLEGTSVKDREAIDGDG